MAVAPGGDRLLVFGGARTAVLHDAVTGDQRARLDHHDGVLAAAFAPDGARLATASGDMAVRLWDRDGRATMVRGHLHGVTAVAWSPDGAALASASLDGTVRRWDVGGDEPAERWSRRGHRQRPRHLVWLDDDRLAVGTDGGLVLYRRDGARLASVELGAVRSLVVAGALVLVRLADEIVAWDPIAGLRWRCAGGVMAPGARAGEILVGAGARVIAVDAGTGEERRVLGEHDGPVTALAVVGDAVVSGGVDAVVRVWSAPPRSLGCAHVVVDLCVRGDAVVTITQDGSVTCWRLDEAGPARSIAPPRSPRWRVELGVAAVDLAVSPDGSRVAISGGPAVEIRAVADGAPLARLDGGELTCRATWTRRLLGVRLQTSRQIRAWHGDTLALLGDAGAPCFELQVIADRWLITHGSSRIGIHEIGDDALTPLASRPMQAVVNHTVSPDGAMLLVGGQASAAAELLAFDGVRTLGRLGKEVERAEFSPDGRLLAASTHTAVELWTVPDLRRVATLAAAGVFRAYWSPRGDRLAIHDRDDALILADAAGRELFRRGRAGSSRLTGFGSPAFSSDGTRLGAGARSGPAYLFDAATGDELARLGGHAVDHVGAWFLPGAGRILTRAHVTPTPDLTAKLWTHDGAPIAILAGHGGESWWQAVTSPDGRWLVTIVNGDPAPRLWRTDDGAPCGALPGHTGLVRSAAFTPGSDALLTLDEHGVTQRWDL